MLCIICGVNAPILRIQESGESVEGKDRRPLLWQFTSILSGLVFLLHRHTSGHFSTASTPSPCPDAHNIPSTTHHPCCILGDSVREGKRWRERRR